MYSYCKDMGYGKEINILNLRVVYFSLRTFNKRVRKMDQKIE